MGNILPGYIHNERAKWHITFDGDNLVVRIVDFKDLGTPRLFTHLPAGNVVIIAPVGEMAVPENHLPDLSLGNPGIVEYARRNPITFWTERSVEARRR